MKIQFHIYHDSLNCPLIVTGKKKLISALAGMNNFKGTVRISARGYETMIVSGAVAQLLSNNALAGRPTVFQYLGEVFTIRDAVDVVTLLIATRTERLYVDGEVIKTSATTYQTVFRKTEELLC